jgi:hypothetical protein
MTQFMTANSFLGLGIQNARGTAATSPTFIPITAPQVTPMQVFLRDEALRGSPTTVYDQVLGVRHDEYDVKGYCYADSFPILLRAILGGTDTVAGSGPYTHGVKLLNNNTTGSQPPAVTIQDFDGATAFQMIDAQMSELSLTFGAEAAAEWNAKFIGNPYTQIATPSASFTPASFVPGWDITTTVGSFSITAVSGSGSAVTYTCANSFTPGTQVTITGVTGGTGGQPYSGTYTVATANSTQFTVANTQTGAATLSSASATLSLGYVVDGEIRLVRNTAPIFTMGQTAPRANFAGPLEVTGRLLCVVENTSDIFSNATNGYALFDGPQATVITLKDPATNYTIAFTMTKAQFQDVKRQRGKSYVEVEVNFTGNANTTDAAASSGYSPVATVTTNGVPTAYAGS